MRKSGKLARLLGLAGLSVLLVAALLVSACAAPTPAPGAKTLKIGVCEALTGFGAEGHTPIVDGAELCRDWINDNGGITINGQQYLIELCIADGKGSVEGYVAAAKKLVYEDNVKFLMGGIETPFHLAIRSVTEPAKVLRVCHYVCEVPEELGPESPYTFSTGFSTQMGVIASMKYLAEAYPEVKTITVINPDDASAPYLTTQIDREAKKYGITIVEDMVWPFETQDWYPVMTKALASKPDGIFYTNGWPSHAGGMLKASRELGFTGPLAGANEIPPAAVLAVAGTDAGTDYFNHGYVDKEYSGMPPMMKEVIETARTKLGKFEQNVFFGWNSLWCLTQAIEHAQSLDPTEVAESWRHMESIETIFGPATMGGQEMYGVNQVVVAPIAITALEDGQVKHVKWMTIEVP